MADRDGAIVLPMGYDLKVKPTDEKLKADSASLVSQYLQFWLPGEVECTVILGRPGDKRPTYSTSIISRERLLYSLEVAKVESQIQAVLVHGNRMKR